MTKRNSTSKSSRSKPQKPSPDFPLYAHANGHWAKKIRGKLHYFGPWDDPDGALKRYQEQAADLHAGRMPQTDHEALTVYRLCGLFLTYKKEQRDGGELSPRTYLAYADICKRIIRVFGGGRLVSDLKPADFAKLRASMAKTWGPVRLASEIVRARTPFNWAWKQQYIDKPVAYGASFNVPRKKIVRQARARKGPRLFERDELRTVLEAAGQPLRSMILLAINCGFGNADVAQLPMHALDLERGWIDFARPKTGISRRCWLWPETIDALRDWLKIRPTPLCDDDAELVFITSRGASWGKDIEDNPISKEMRKLLNRLGITGNKNFYALRHTVETIGGEAKDQPALDHIMGHARNDMASVYRERISDERLRAVAEHIRAWLFGGDGDENADSKADDKPRILRLPGA
ncbi:MAG: hypothetical protein KatS3mg105_1057 [Gemmatales bacterium]|nr:MAG: hypothetical protein KatS3mg105_1057 [Gemmatales bacterium]